jgi:hypothetical protein
MADSIINYAKGITRSPSDFLSTDGELEECVNLEVVDGELRTAEMPVAVTGLSLNTGEIIQYAMTTESGLHCYITLTEQQLSQSTRTYTLGAVSKEMGRFSLSKVYTSKPRHILSMGNILIVYLADSVEYFIYKSGDFSYIGNKMPELDIAFSLTGKLEYESYTMEGVDYIEDNDMRMPDFSSDNAGNTAQAVMGYVNKFINEKALSEGYFMYPFFIRWAYRLFDGTHTHQSAPILMLPTTFAAPLSGLKADGNVKKRTTFPIYVASYLAEIVANIPSDQLSELNDWSDIIMGIDFYVSPQFYTYDESDSGLMMDYKNMANGSEDTYYKKSQILGYVKNVTGGGFIGVYNLYDFTSKAVTDFGNYTFTLPIKDMESEVYKSIREQSNFYKYAYLELSELKSVDNHLKEYGLENTSNDIILQQTTMDDDYLTHDVIVPDSALVYNKRLNISSIRRNVFNGFSPRAMMQYTEHIDAMYSHFSTWQAVVTMDGNRLVSDAYKVAPYAPYLFYPNADAQTMMLVDTAAKDTYIQVALKEHTGLNGAYYFGGFDQLVPTTVSGNNYVPSSVSSVWSDEPNSLWLSEVSNPFTFDINGMYTVGNGDVIAISSLVRPVSQGQFGEYPLIAFCTDGNYGLRVSDEGYYTNISPMQEDVALSQEQITNMESSILVVTQKGIMQTNGSEITPLCAQMDGRSKPVLENARKSSWEVLIGYAEDAEGFLSYVRGARMAYDYASDRVLVYRPDKTYSYLVRMDTKAVTKLVIGEGEAIQTHVIDYPDVILQTDKALYSLYEKEDVNDLDARRLGFALTRPLTLGSPLIHKVVERVKNLWSRMDEGSSVKYALYGSNDNLTYHRCVSRFGHPWKYYKLAVYTDMLPGESLSGTQITSSTRRSHKLR